MNPNKDTILEIPFFKGILHSFVGFIFPTSTRDTRAAFLRFVLKVMVTAFNQTEVSKLKPKNHIRL